MTTLLSPLRPLHPRPLLLTPQILPIPQALPPSRSFTTTLPLLKRRSRARPERRITLIRYHLFHPSTPRPLRFSRLRGLRHWTIHRAWQLYTAQARAARERELERFYNAMHEACEALRGLEVGDGRYEKTQGNLYRRAIHKRGVWDGWPIEASRAQTEWPSVEGWPGDWRR
ncbi:MAG: hypothetical protein M1816_001527 [Peltula sp. TS41687]|nr:MAG: hypothetical protein M1816_001527 [Peltula sp. TS41687]